MKMEFLTLCLLGVILLFSWVVIVKRVYFGVRHRLPPGPRGLPVIGCPWALRFHFHHLFTDLAQKYGDIVSINIMGDTIIGLNSADVVRETFNSAATADIFAGRGPAPIANEELSYMVSFIQPGPLYSKQRKLLHKVLNHYGEGLRESERTIQEELTHVVEWLENAGGFVNMDEILYPSLINTITILLTGRRYDYDSPVLRNIKELVEFGAVNYSHLYTVLNNLFPFLKYIPVGFGKHFRRLHLIVKTFHKTYFEDMKATYDTNVTRGMVDFLFRHQEETRLKDGHTWLDDLIIKATTQEMLMAGVMTTRGALYSFFLIMAHNPKVMKKIQDEIEAVVGESRFPKLEDREKMPYTLAAIFELLRYISHAPLGLLHKTTDDVKLQGYDIPKNTTVIYNSWNFHHDGQTFADPWQFKPERFLDSDGQLVPVEHHNRQNWMPFGTGRRSCLGEAFAKSRIFLFITTLLQRFDFTQDPTRPVRSCDPRTYRPGLVISPYLYYLKVTFRG